MTINKTWLHKLNPFLILILIALVAFKNNDVEPKKTLLPTKMDHIGILVEDIEIAIDKWVIALDLENRPTVIIADGHEDNPTHYRGKLSDAKVKLAFIQLENIQLELLEPFGDEESHWREFLNEHGSIVHHAGFEIEGLGETYFDLYQKEGYSLAQKGGWDGGEYAYIDSQKDLGIIIELLERYSE